ncbi:hypothetical protein BDN70DRAFT_39025 [Pholiota conissans]|uniref:Uncharacterized protein n=1 Tax=Pholiota conissans TaxID=109636 RepID=A0A9P6CSU3_9AGAR|nr:hypothetical protein BDN70DRAFT_39025 [Pholiota conissans]
MSNPISHLPQSPVSHHVHRDDEPLPGARGAAPTVDYSPNAIQQAVLPPSEVGETQNFHPPGSPHHDTTHPHHDHCAHHPSCHRDAFCVHRQSAAAKQSPLPPVPGYVGTTENREYTTGGLQGPEYDIDGKPVGGEKHTYSKPSLGDKIIGKTEQERSLETQAFRRRDRPAVSARTNLSSHIIDHVFYLLLHILLEIFCTIQSMYHHIMSRNSIIIQF